MHYNLRLVSVSVLFLTLASGCKSESSKNKTKSQGKIKNQSPAVEISAPFLSLADIQRPAAIKTFSKDEMIDELNEVEEIYYTEPDSTDSADCDTAVLTIPYRANKDTVTIGGLVDTNSCMEDMPQISSSTMRFFMSIQCDGEDFSAMNGKYFKDLANSFNSWCANKTKRRLMQTETVFKVNFKSEGNDISYTVKNLFTQMSSTGEPCLSKYEGNQQTHDTCVSTSVSIYSDVILNGAPSQMEGKYIVHTLENARSTQGARFYSSGVARLILNNWNGTLTYRGNDAAPNWTMSNGNESANGTFIGSAFSLTGRSRGLVLPEIKPRFN